MTIELMRALAVGVTAAGLVLVGCGGGESEDAAGGGSETTTTPAESGGSDASGDGAAAEGGAADAGGEAATLDPATPDGAARVLLTALAEGKFEQAAAVVSPDSPGKALLDQLVTTQASLDAVEEPTPDQMAAQMAMRAVLSSVSGMFRDSTVELVTEEGDQAVVSITRPGMPALPAVPVVKDGEFWFVRIPERFVDLNANTADAIRDQLGGGGGGMPG